jgi:hypothetical protein
MSTAAQLTGAISNEVKRELRARQVGQQAGGGGGEPRQDLRIIDVTVVNGVRYEARVRGGKNTYGIKNVSHNGRQPRVRACTRRTHVNTCGCARARNGTYVGQARGTSKAAVEIVQDKSGFRARSMEKARKGRRSQGERKNAWRTGTRAIEPIDAPGRPQSVKGAKMHRECPESKRSRAGARPVCCRQILSFVCTYSRTLNAHSNLRNFFSYVSNFSFAAYEVYREMREIYLSPVASSL